MESAAGTRTPIETNRSLLSYKVLGELQEMGLKLLKTSKVCIDLGSETGTEVPGLSQITARLEKVHQQLTGMYARYQKHLNATEAPSDIMQTVLNSDPSNSLMKDMWMRNCKAETEGYA